MLYFEPFVPWEDVGKLQRQLERVAPPIAARSGESGEHGGGIHGFRSRTISLPDDHIFVAVLSNNGGVNPEKLAFKTAALTIGEPYHEPTPIELQPEALTLYEGMYEIDGSEGMHVNITRESNQLFFQYGEGPRLKIAALAPHEFFFRDMSFDRLYFSRDPNESILSVELRGRTGMPEVAKKVDKT